MLINEIGSRDLQTQKKAIKKSVDLEDSQEILDRVESTLQSGELAQRLGAVLKQDADTKKLYRLVSQVIVNVPSALDDKLKFIEDFPKGFVKISTLMSPGVVTDFSKSIPDPFAYRVFMALKDVVIQGVGPGEFALAALSPRIKSMGQRSGGGDLLINGVNVEVKGARRGEGGQISGGLVDGPLAMTPCASRTRFHPCADCVAIEDCRIRHLMQRARDAVAAVLENCSLAELAALAGDAGATPLGTILHTGDWKIDPDPLLGDVAGPAWAAHKFLNLKTGDFFALIPPDDDIHRITTTSDVTSVSLHLLTNDTGCIWRHRYDAETGAPAPFRSGYVNVACPPDHAHAH